MTFLPHKHIITHHGDTETQRKIEGQISYLNVAERRFLEIWSIILWIYENLRSVNLFF